MFDYLLSYTVHALRSACASRLRNTCFYIWFMVYGLWLLVYGYRLAKQRLHRL